MITQKKERSWPVYQWASNTQNAQPTDQITAVIPNNMSLSRGRGHQPAGRDLQVLLMEPGPDCLVQMVGLRVYSLTEFSPHLHHRGITHHTLNEKNPRAIVYT